MGAIDVIAIRHSDGSLTCSPFHARFRKLSRKGERNVVRLLVNGRPSNISMKLGSMGEVFFVEKTKEPVKRRFRTSPCLSPENESRNNRKFVDCSKSALYEGQSKEKDMNVCTSEMKVINSQEIQDSHEVSRVDATTIRRTRSRSVGDTGDLSGRSVSINMPGPMKIFPSEESLLLPSPREAQKFGSSSPHFHATIDDHHTSTSTSCITGFKEQTQTQRAQDSHVSNENLQVLTRERSYSEGEDTLFHTIPPEVTGSFVSLSDNRLDKWSPYIWTWAWGTLPKKDDPVQTKIGDEQSIIFSFCGHVLVEDGTRHDSPRTPEDMKMVLAKYRLGTHRSRREILGHEGFFR